jgi:arsenate reductase
MAMTVTIYHNPSCSNSKKALELIRAHGVEPKIVEYLKTPLTPQSEPPKAVKSVQWTDLSGERRELGRAAVRTWAQIGVMS